MAQNIHFDKRNIPRGTTGESILPFWGRLVGRKWIYLDRFGFLWIDLCVESRFIWIDSVVLGRFVGRRLSTPTNRPKSWFRFIWIDLCWVRFLWIEPESGRIILKSSGTGPRFRPALLYVYMSVFEFGWGCSSTNPSGSFGMTPILQNRTRRPHQNRL